MKFFRVILLVPLIIASATLAAESQKRTLCGKLIRQDGKPVTAASLSAVWHDREEKVNVKEGGVFCLREGTYPLTLEVNAPGYLPLRVKLAAPPEEMKLVLTPVTFSSEVEVTSTRAKRGQDPVTTTNVSEEEIEALHWAQDLPMILVGSPGFYSYNDNGNGIGYSYFTLRGFDMRRTGVSINGVPLNDAESHAVFFIDHANILASVADIQVQRGVSASPFGGPAIGGVVDIRMRPPSQERRFRLVTFDGSWDTHAWSFEYDTGRSPSGWAASFRLSRVDSDGYREQSWTSMWSYFMQLEHESENSRTTLLLFGGPEETHLAYAGISKDYLEGRITGDKRRDRRFNPLTYPQQIDHFFQPHEQLIHVVDISPDLTWKTTLYYFQGDGYFKQYKSDRWMPEYDLPPFEENGELVETTDLVRKRTVSEWDGGVNTELSYAMDGATVSAGLALRIHHGHHWGEVVWAEHYPPGLEPNHRYYDYEVSKDSWQPFVQGSYQLSSQLRLWGGLTWVRHKYEMSKDRRRGMGFDVTYEFLLPKAGITWKLGEATSVYASWARGAREPAFRDIYDPQDYWSQMVDLEEEKVTDYELGIVTGGDRWWVAANLFWLHFDNEIVWAGALDDNGVPIMANGAVSNHRGVEAEAGFAVLDWLEAKVAASYMKNTFSHFVEYDWEGNAEDYSGNRIAGAPDLLLSASCTAHFGRDSRFTLFLRHRGKIYLDNTEDMRKHPEIRNQPDYVHRVVDPATVLDMDLRLDLGDAVARAMWVKKAWLRLRVDNVLDELYESFGYMDDGEPLWIPAATRSVYVGLITDW